MIYGATGFLRLMVVTQLPSMTASKNTSGLPTIPPTEKIRREDRSYCYSLVSAIFKSAFPRHIHDREQQEASLKIAPFESLRNQNLSRSFRTFAGFQKILKALHAANLSTRCCLCTSQ